MRQRSRNILDDKAAKHTVRKAGHVAAALLLVACMALPLVGCKDTDVLTQVIIDQDAPIDYSLPPRPLHSQDGHDGTTPENQIDDIDREEEDIPQDPQYSEDAPADETVKEHPNSDETANNETATAGSETSGNAGDNAEPEAELTGVGDASNANAGAGSSPGSADEGDAANGSGESDGADTSGGAARIVTVVPDEPNTPENNDSNDGNNQEGDQTGADNSNSLGDSNQGGSGEGGMSQTYANDGTYANLDIKSRKIAAAGQYAIVVQMLGGRGALAATDGVTLGRMRSDGAFPNETDDVVVAWNGDGTAAESADLDAIVASGADTVLTSKSFGGITQEQAEYLNSKGVSVVEMPVIGVENAFDRDICKAVEVVGYLLKDAGTGIQYDAADMARQWKSFHDTTLTTFLDRNGGYSFNTEGGESWARIYQGLEVATTSWDTTYTSGTTIYTAYANLWTMAPRTSTTRYDENFVQREYDLSDGLPAQWGVSPVLPASDFYLIEYYMQHSGVVDSDYGTVSRLTDSSYVEMSWGELNHPIGGSLSDNVARVGTTSFPAVIASTDDIARRWAEAGSKTGAYLNMGRPYDIYVLPNSSITGSWQDGTPESFLVAPWTWGMFRNSMDLSECSGIVNDYYSTFYRCGAAGILNDYGAVYEATCPSS